MRILIVDDHQLIADTLSFKLEKMGDEVVTAGTFARAQQVLSNPDTELDVVLIDFFLRDSNGLTSLKRLTHEGEHPPIVVMSGMLSEETVPALQSAGAQGYVSKNTPLKVVRSILQLVANGGRYFPPGINLGNDVSGAAAIMALSATNRNILALLPLGLSNSEIAQALDMTEYNVKAHLRTIYKTLGVSNRTKAALIADEYRLVSEEGIAPDSEKPRCNVRQEVAPRQDPA